MKNLLLPILLSLTLTACGSSASGGGTTPDNNNSTKSDPTCSATNITLCGDNMPNPFTFAESLGTITPKTQTTTTAYGEDSLTDAATANSSEIILPAIAVLLNESTHYKREHSSLDWQNTENKGITTTPNASLSRTSLTASKYPTVQLTLSGTTFTAEIYADDTYDANVTTYTGADTASMALLGFTANNMALVEWEKDQPADFTTETITETTLYSKQGMLIAGIATTDFTALDGATQFTGKGKGSYGVLQADKSFTTYGTVFNTRINVDFVSKMLDFYSYGTACDELHIACRYRP